MITIKKNYWGSLLDTCSTDSQTNLARKSAGDDEEESTSSSDDIKPKQVKKKSNSGKPATLKQEQDEDDIDEMKPGKEGWCILLCITTQ